jgi:uncharacterized damage-inducible protein DinB
MVKEIHSIIRNLENTLDGEPWYGRPVYALLREVDASIAFKKPTKDSHSLMDLLYHMLTWTEFTLKRIQKEPEPDLKAFEKLDWRPIDKNTHNWDDALAAYIATHQEIIAILKTRDDSLLGEVVDYRNYNFRFLLNGLIQHNIYHAGQVAYLHKQLS